mgnify:CR=1 FL=1
MAITYKWSIPQMNANIQAEGENNVIFRVQYVYTGYEESGAVTYTANVSSFQDFTYVEGEPFVPYENTEAFENVVIGWLEDATDVANMQSIISEQLEAEVNPVDEDLYFTWMNPMPAPTPDIEDEEE